MRQKLKIINQSGGGPTSHKLRATSSYFGVAAADGVCGSRLSRTFQFSDQKALAFIMPCRGPKKCARERAL